MADGGRRVDEATLRYVAGVLARLDHVRTASLFPANKQESLVAVVNEAYYPPAVTEIRLEIRLYTNGDFHVSYFEDCSGNLRRCRWDRHEQDHSTRDHYHPLPTAGTAADRSFPVDLVETLEVVIFPWIDDRLGSLWEG